MVDYSHIISWMHFKPSAGNSYLHARSHHQLRWIKNVPFGQFCWLRGKCTCLQDYDEQSDLLRKRFLEKGYDQDLRKDPYKYWYFYADAVGDLYLNSEGTRASSRPTNTNTQSYIIFSTRYNSKAFAIKRVIKKYWDILHRNPCLTNAIPERPNVLL